MIITAIIGCVERPKKSLDTIKQQMERIYALYIKGYGTNKMLQNCEDKVYVILSNMEY